MNLVYGVYRGTVMITLHKSRGLAQEKCDRKNAKLSKNDPNRYYVVVIPLYE